MVMPSRESLDQKPSFFSHLTFTTGLSDNSRTEPQNPSASSPHSRAWIKGVVVCSWVISTVLSINILLTIIAAGIAYSRNGEDDFSFAAIYTGDCSIAKNWTTGIHLVINILSTAMLGASNYCMQCLASPSRAQVDEAHSKRNWLSIGVPNIWGLLKRQRGKRQWLGWILLATSLPIHLMFVSTSYNSAIFFAFGPTEYAVVVGPSGPMHGNGSADWNDCFPDIARMDAATLNAELSRSDLKTLSNKECIDTFAQDYVSGQRLVVLVTNEPLPEREPVVLMLSGNSGSFGSGDGSAFAWMCGGDYRCTKGVANEMVNGDEWTIQPLKWSTPSIKMEVPTDYGFHNISGKIYFHTPEFPESTPDTIRLNEILDEDTYEDEVQAELDNPSNWVNASFPGDVTILGHLPVCHGHQTVQSEQSKLPQTYPIEHCLTVPMDESCQLVFSPPICLIVIGCNLIKLICTLLAARDGRKDVFLTIGDAVASYLARPDSTTEGSCLLSKPLVNKGVQGWHKKPKKKRKKPRAVYVPVELTLPLHLPSQKRWFQAASTGRWAFTITIFACLIGPAIYLLRIGMLDFYSSLGATTIWDTTLGEASPSTTLSSLHRLSGTPAIFSMVLLANVPQLLVSAAYFMLNALLTIMLGAVEYDDYSRDRKPLRVSWPRGAQRSTYYLSLPYRYSSPLLVASAVLHWLVSQSFFFVEVIPFDINGVPDPHKEIITCGHSPVATIFAIAVGGSLLVVSMLLGLRRFRSPMPLAAQCSAAISAACHPTTASPDDDANHALKPVRWGEIAGVYSGPTMTFSNRIRGDLYPTGSGNGSEGLLPDDSGGVGALDSKLYHCTFTSEDVCEPRKGRVYI